MVNPDLTSLTSHAQTLSYIINFIVPMEMSDLKSHELDVKRQFRVRHTASDFLEL